MTVVPLRSSERVRERVEREDGEGREGAQVHVITGDFRTLSQSSRAQAHDVVEEFDKKRGLGGERMRFESSPHSQRARKRSVAQTGQVLVFLPGALRQSSLSSLKKKKRIIINAREGKR